MGCRVGYVRGGPKQRPSVRRQILLAVAGAALGGTLMAGSAEASLLNSPSLSPDHGSPGTVVHVTGFPVATECPTVRMYIASVTGITSFTDPRLHRLSGTVTYGLGSNSNGSTGPLVSMPIFRFTVPALRPGLYATYWTCPGGGGWDGLFEDQRPWMGGPAPSSYAPFRVEPLAPGATLPPTTTAPDVIGSSDASGPGVWLLIGMLSIAAAAMALQRGGHEPG
jgi:hypothetical protein